MPSIPNLIYCTYKLFGTKTTIQKCNQQLKQMASNSVEKCGLWVFFNWSIIHSLWVFVKINPCALFPTRSILLLNINLHKTLISELNLENVTPFNQRIIILKRELINCLLPKERCLVFSCFLGTGWQTLMSVDLGSFWSTLLCSFGLN